jgi:hypothetical protein
VGREEVDDAVDRLHGVDGVEGREHEVAGLGRAQRGGDRLLVAHLADEDDVGVLAHRRAHGATEGLGVDADLPLLDRRQLVVVEDLDGVLDGDHVHLAGAVDVVDHGGERRGFPRTGGPVTRTRPRGSLETGEHDRQAQVSMVAAELRTRRKIMATLPR